MTIRSHGGPEVLTLEDLPQPSAGPGEVRVRVAAVALNHVDLWVRRGLPHLKLEYPFLLGADVAGVVDAVGPGVVDVKPGDEIVVNPGHACGRCRACLSGHDNLCRRFQLMGEDRPGGYAEWIVVPAANVVPRPPSLSAIEAAALPVTFLTAWQMLVRKARLTPGQDLLIHAAGSGVGVAALQIGKLLSARVIATASTADKRARLLELGADEVLASGSGVVDAVRKLTGKRGVDVVIDHVGADTLAQSIACACWGGRVVTCGATSGWDARVDLRHVFFRQIELLGSTMAPRGDLYDIVGLAARGRLRPIIDKVLPLEEAAAAHELLEARGVFGKLVLTLSGD